MSDQIVKMKTEHQRSQEPVQNSDQEGVIILVGRNVDVKNNEDGTIDFNGHKDVGVQEDFFETLMSRMSFPKKAIKYFSWAELTDKANRSVKLFLDTTTNVAHLATNVDIGKMMDALAKQGYGVSRGDNGEYIAIYELEGCMATYRVEYSRYGYRTGSYIINPPDAAPFPVYGQKPTGQVMWAIHNRVEVILQSTASVRECIMGGDVLIEAAETKPLGVVTLTEVPENMRSCLSSGVPLIDVCRTKAWTARCIVTEGPDLPGVSEVMLNEEVEGEEQ